MNILFKHIRLSILLIGCLAIYNSAYATNVINDYSDNQNQRGQFVKQVTDSSSYPPEPSVVLRQIMDEEPPVKNSCDYHSLCDSGTNNSFEFIQLCSKVKVDYFKNLFFNKEYLKNIIFPHHSFL